MNKSLMLKLTPENEFSVGEHFLYGNFIFHAIIISKAVFDDSFCPLIDNARACSVAKRW